MGMTTSRIPYPQTHAEMAKPLWRESEGGGDGKDFHEGLNADVGSTFRKWPP